MNDESDKTRENRLRKLAQHSGFILQKDRAKSYSLDHQGGYMIVTVNNVIEAGEKYDLTLDDMEKFFQE